MNRAAMLAPSRFSSFFRAAFAASGALLAAACGREAPVYYTGPASGHFDGKRFFNPDGESGTGGAQRDGAIAFIEIGLGRAGHHGWPSSVPIRPSVPPRRVDGQDMRVTWIGHATTLVQTEGLNILIDPVWATRDSPVQFAGPKRVRAPGVALSDLPPIDIILISHNHYDHLDIPTLQFLAQRDKPAILAGLGNDTLLADYGLTAIARDWGQTVMLRGIPIRLTRAHHWSAHWLNDRDRALWTGFRLTLPGGDLFYAGDTGAGDMHWPVEARGQAPIRFAILPIAPYKLLGPPTGNHIDPEQAVAAFSMLGAAYALGVHWGTFQLGPEPIDGPPNRLRASLAAHHIDAVRFRTMEAGESWMIPRLPVAAKE
ncbi:MBL fold metallo-hydrolase [Flavisphingomonas formosensis]|uniref:MBL fold metallo-hydrolase n=1 Tax=Flavisphingomonas formosensis TaxID=861534 RepID=UPI001E5451E7|nr:MBL fold metallo-hydrolase [Sphingomonas formosensis]